MALPPDMEDASPDCNERSYDGLLTSAIHRARVTDRTVSPSQLARLIVRTHRCRRSEAQAAVEDYCARHGMALTEPPTSTLRILAGCILALFVLFLLAAALFGMLVGVPHRSAYPILEPTWVVLTKYGWAFLLTVLLLRDLRGQKLRQSLSVLRQIRPTLVAQNFCVLLVTIGFAYLIVSLFPFLDRSWLYLLPGNGGHAANLSLLPATIKYFGPFFLVVLALNLPALAHSEEVRYRQGTRDWRDVAGRSVRFGLVHCFVGIPLYAGLALTVAGLWFTYQYFRGGVEQSTLHHVTYNATVIVFLFILLLFQF